MKAIEAVKIVLAVDGSTVHGCMFKAVQLGKARAVETLIQLGVNINRRHATATLLHWVTFFGQKKVAKLLIGAGAKINAEDDSGKTPLSWAIRENHTQIAALLRRHGAKEGGE